MKCVLLVTALSGRSAFSGRCFNNCLQHRRTAITAQQASNALRPFYFAVHPDRFAQEPDVRSNNERALQVFNGYLNNLFPKPDVSQSPVQVEFAIRNKKNELRHIQISLSGYNVEQIIRTALEQCELSTKNVPKSGRNNDRPSSAWSTKGLDKMWHDLQENERQRRRGMRSMNLLSGIRTNRERALQRLENHRCIMELIKDEIDEIIRRTGVTQILWSIDWDQSHMRRCLQNVQSMILHADKDEKDNVVYALHGRKLIFGRGSYVCCDGSLQFGADDATGAWQKVCIETGLRRFDVRSLELLVERVRELLGGVNLVVKPYANVLNTIQQMQIFIAMISSQPKQEREALQSLLSPGISVEIVNCYHELMVLEGCFQIPCCVDFPSFKQFVAVNASRCRHLRQEHLERKRQLEMAKDSCVKALSLEGLNWDTNLSADTLLEGMDKLCRVQPDKRADFAEISLHLSSSPKIYVMFNGRLSVPIEWVKEL